MIYIPLKLNKNSISKRCATSFLRIYIPLKLNKNETKRDNKKRQKEIYIPLKLNKNPVVGLGTVYWNLYLHSSKVK